MGARRVPLSAAKRTAWMLAVARRFDAYLVRFALRLNDTLQTRGKRTVPAFGVRSIAELQPISRHAELSTRPDLGRDVLFYRRAARSRLGVAGRSYRRSSPCGARDASAHAVRSDRVGGFAGTHACTLEHAGRRCRLFRALGHDQKSLLAPAFGSDCKQRKSAASARGRHMATPILGTPDSRRGRSADAFRLHSFQSGKARILRASCRMAVFHVSSMGPARSLRMRLGRRRVTFRGIVRRVSRCSWCASPAAQRHPTKPSSLG